MTNNLINSMGFDIKPKNDFPLGGNDMFKSKPESARVTCNFDDLKKSIRMFLNCVNATTCNSRLPVFEAGSESLQLQKCISDLPSFSNGSWMFCNSDIRGWNIHLPKLINGAEMREPCKNHWSINISTASLQVGNNMPNECFDLTYSNYFPEFISDDNILEICSTIESISIASIIHGLAAYTDGSYHEIAFENVSPLSQQWVNILESKGWTLDGSQGDCLPNGRFDTTPRSIVKGGPCLINGESYFKNNKTVSTVTGKFINMTAADYMFCSCSSLKNSYALLPKLQECSYMFEGCSALSRWTTSMPELRLSDRMFEGCASLGSFESDLPKLTSSVSMFYGCSTLGVFAVDMPNLADSSQMFDICRNLLSFSSNLNHLAKGYKMFHHCAALVDFESALPSLTNGNQMFYYCANLTDFKADLPSLLSGRDMFKACASITYCSSDLSSLTDGYAMFGGCTSLTSFDGALLSLSNASGMFDNTALNAESITNIISSIPTYTTGEHLIGFQGVLALNQDHVDAAAAKGWTLEGTPQNDCLANGTFDQTPRAIVRGGPCLINGSDMFKNMGSITTVTGAFANLSNGDSMFYGCRELSTFTSDLSALTIGDSMFNSCGHLSTFTSDLPALTIGASMFNSCGRLSTFTSDLPSLTNGDSMFYSCGSLRDFVSDLSALTHSFRMFRGTSLSSFTSDMSSLTKAYEMFSSGYNLSTFTSNLPSLTEGRFMFSACDRLSTFTSNLPSLTDGRFMFSSCGNLRTFTTDLSSLTDGRSMFVACEKLSVFTSNLSSLADGYGMFSSCTLLNVESIENIISSLPIYTTGEHHIGFRGVLALTQGHKEAAAAKGWTIEEIPQGDCYLNGVFDRTPRAIVRGGPCLIDGSSVFRDVVELTTVTGDFANLANGNEMFYGCKNLTTFTSDMPLLAVSFGMFAACTKLSVFDACLSALTVCGHTFYGCTNLSIFTSDLSDVTNSTSMFDGCTNLRTFTANFTRLTMASYMFSGCTLLNAQSIENIISSLPTYATGTHPIGFQGVRALTQTHVNLAAAKGWTVEGSPLS